MSELRLVALATKAHVGPGDDLVELIVAAVGATGETLAAGDVVVVTSKVVAKAEGRVVPFSGSEEHKQELIDAESTRTLRRRGPLRITETHHGFVNANAGIDVSNTVEGTAVLLPVDPDRSARRLRAGLARRAGVDVAVVVTDTFGRAWRNGVADVAIGVAGLQAVLDLRGTADALGRTLEVTEVAVADEVAGAANLVLHKDGGTPFALVRGLHPSYFGAGSAQQLVRRPQDDLFR